MATLEVGRKLSTMLIHLIYNSSQSWAISLVDDTAAPVDLTGVTARIVLDEVAWTGTIDGNTITWALSDEQSRAVQDGDRGLLVLTSGGERTVSMRVLVEVQK